jgi:hypothetical protein
MEWSRITSQRGLAPNITSLIDTGLLFSPQVLPSLAAMLLPSLSLNFTEFRQQLPMDNQDDSLLSSSLSGAGVGVIVVPFNAVETQKAVNF